MRAWFLSCILAVQLLAPAVSRAQEPVQVAAAQFGAADTSDPNNFIFTPTNKVPYAIGQSYGWIIIVKTDKPAVHWKEEFTLPGGAEAWGVSVPGATQSVSADRRVSVLEKDVSMADGPVLANFWSVAEGDPRGHYHIKVTIDGSVEENFDFDVE